MIAASFDEIFKLLVKNSVKARTFISVLCYTSLSSLTPLTISKINYLYVCLPVSIYIDKDSYSP